MGCDIHTYREKFVDGHWQTADKWTAYDWGDGDKGLNVEFDDRAYTGRNYDLFGLLSRGVRRDFDFGLSPRGMPLDPCSEIAAEVEEWSGDGHSHSYLYLHELRALRAWCDGKTMPISGMMHTDQLQRLKASMATDAPDYGLLYPYCQGTNDPAQVKFTIDLPISYVVGECLDRIIASFDGIDGENHRLVFFFDN